MANTSVTDLAYGDSGKGKISDILSPEHDFVVRYAGGANAGHTIVVDGQKYKFHHLPCGVFAPNHPQLVLANGMVINPVALEKEIDDLRQNGFGIVNQLKISDKAHCVMPWHIASDIKKGGKIGTTGKGIGPCYADKMHRSYAIRMGDLLSALKEEKTKRFFASDTALHGEGLWKQYYEAAEYLQQFICDTGKLLREAVKNKHNILFEGAQGIQLDVDHSSCYPYCTSSGVGPAAIPQACGLPNLHIDRIIGVTKCYWTRVGAGSFRTEIIFDRFTGLNELFIGKSEQLIQQNRDNTADEIRKLGHEYGTTTGRPRRIGWMDLDLLKEGVELTGATELALMHCDTISKIISSRTVRIVDNSGYREFPIWKSPEDQSFQNFCDHIETNVGIPIRMTSWGPDRINMWNRN